jgi:hypothetical protein
MPPPTATTTAQTPATMPIGILRFDLKSSFIVKIILKVEQNGDEERFGKTTEVFPKN